MDVHLFNEPNNGDQDSILMWYFNSINGNQFPSVIKKLLNKIGYGNEYFSCDFETLDEEEQPPFDGVCIRFMDDCTIVSHEYFYSFLITACSKFLESHIDRYEEMKSLIYNATVIRNHYSKQVNND
ncbi:ribonuclease toxin immunity protein CdiI [Vibrio gazogenes]|uniref:CDI immunity protein domain-containing protein n=1 Tax=Vibrio gazogenes TaxID=687 RepID=A0A1Z2SL69_VIBGA|nr:ribonuclease toxin immunity protein CdiI [Vibrio gazogenes]ASA57876.1 hypothetical protein BSQ33_19340 [Vibrio gazogenes]